MYLVMQMLIMDPIQTIENHTMFTSLCQIEDLFRGIHTNNQLSGIQQWKQNVWHYQMHLKKLSQESNLDKNFTFLLTYHRLRFFLTTNLPLRLQKIQRIIIEPSMSTLGTMPFVITFEMVKSPLTTCPPTHKQRIF